MATSATSLTITTILPGSPKWVEGNWIAIQIPKAVVILTPSELKTAILRGKWWTRQQRLAARLKAPEAEA
jgi:hypothetical protein